MNAAEDTQLSSCYQNSVEREHGFLFILKSSKILVEFESNSLNFIFNKWSGSTLKILFFNFAVIRDIVVILCWFIRFSFVDLDDPSSLRVMRYPVFQTRTPLPI